MTDFTWLVDSGEYKEEDLPAKDKQFIEGMRYVQTDVMPDCLEGYRDEVECDNEIPILAEMKYQVVDDFLHYFKDYLESEINGFIVGVLESKEK